MPTLFGAPWLVPYSDTPISSLDDLNRQAVLATATPETLAYIAAVEAADGQRLEDDVLAAIVSFANWRIPLGGACCLMTGPRTLAGKLVPIVGPSPIGVNLVEGDASRWGGIGGNGINKYIRTQYSHLNLNQDSIHAGVWLNAAQSAGTAGYISAGNLSGTSSAVALNRGDASWSHRCATTANSAAFPGALNSAGSLILARNSASEYRFQARNSSVTVAAASAALLSQDREFYVLALHTSLNVAAQFSDAVIGAYSVGPYIDPAEWTARVTALMTALAAAADSVWAAGGGLPALDLDF